MVALFGSTHELASWRGIIEPLLEEKGILYFDPQLGSGARYEQKHAEVEAEVAAKAAVVAIRIESKDLVTGQEVTDANVGTLGEASMAMVQALLKGQRVVLSIEDNITETIKDSGIRAQYAAFFAGIKDMQQLLPNVVNICKDGKVETLAENLVQAIEEQRKNPQKGFEPKSVRQKIEALKNDLKKEDRPWVVFGGASSVAPEKQIEFAAMKAACMTQFPDSAFASTVLSDGELADSWRRVFDPENNFSEKQVFDELRRLFAFEEGPKNRADILIWDLPAFSASPSATVELGFRLVRTLLSDQVIMIAMEPFDEALFMKDKKPEDAQRAKTIHTVARLRALMFEHMKRLNDFQTKNGAERALFGYATTQQELVNQLQTLGGSLIP